MEAKSSDWIVLGASATGPLIMEKLGFNVENVLAPVRALLWFGRVTSNKAAVRCLLQADTFQICSFRRLAVGSDPGTNPEELIAAAGCFSMALAAELEKNGSKPTSIATSATLTPEKDADHWIIRAIRLAVTGRASGTASSNSSKRQRQPCRDVLYHACSMCKSAWTRSWKRESVAA
jgi:organic hydroperoxide reductase OsmC/OhrA